MTKELIYADHAATTKLSPKAKKAMLPWLEGDFGNPSTLYSFARKPRKAISAARSEIAELIGASAEEIYFTSGGTESDNWALTGTAFQYPNQRKHIITSSIEHHAVLHTCAFLEKMGAQITYLPVDEKGVISPQSLDAAIREDTVLVSIMTANNEIGTIEPIRELAQIAHSHGALFHTDAVQAVGHIPLDVSSLDVDMLSASAHKFNGPKGVGFLYIRKGVQLENLLHGGGQESSHRAGTENVAGIVGMAAALSEHMLSLEYDSRYLEMLRTTLVTTLNGANLDYLINGSESHIPGSLSISLRNKDGEALLHRLDLMGIAIATGSACNSQDTELSHVIRAIHIDPSYANGSIRITFGAENTKADAERIAMAIIKICQE